MKAARSFFFAVVALSLSLVVPLAHASRDPDSSSDDPTQISDQIARLSLVEGDVRIARGNAAKHATGGDWGRAAANLPLQSGFSLATGTGRAEIELEDDSTVYLGENSVLIVNLLADEGDTPHTVLTLVSGVATVHVHPSVPGETFLLNASAARLSLQYGSKAFLRVNSYLDATQITPQSDAGLDVDGKSAGPELIGKTITYYTDQHSASEAAATGAGFAAWDAWTAKRVAARSAALTSAMKEAGLTEPLPGLADLAGHGAFFACAPYGTCWQPYARGASAEGSVQPARFHTQRTWQRPHLVLTAQMYGPEYADPYDPLLEEASFPCAPGGIGGFYGRTPYAYQFGSYGAAYGFGAPYNWAECHEGSWIQRNNRYVWVVGTRKHHQCPVRWVKYEGKPAFVPIHPGDVRGKPPLNLDHGVFQLTGNKGASARFVAFRQGASIKTLNTPPREFRALYYPPLQHTEAPQLLARALRTGAEQTLHGTATAPRLTSSPILFNHRSQSFAFARTVEAGGHSSIRTEHFGGNAAGGGARSGGGGSFGGGARSGGEGGGARASSGGGGGASHGGGGGGSAGGGSAGGGGGHR